MGLSATGKAGKAQKGADRSLRTCVRCRKSEHPEGLVRWVLGPDGAVVPDLSGRHFGRGAWSHGSPDCLRGLARALAKSFKAEVTLSDPELAGLLGAAAAHRAWQLLGAARRQRLLACGRTPVQEAVRSGAAELVLVATDAGSAAKLSEVEAMIRQGKASAWGTKDALGKLCGRAEIAVLAVLDLRLAQRLFGAIAMAPRGSGVLAEARTQPTDILVLDGG